MTNEKFDCTVNHNFIMHSRFSEVVREQ